MPPKAHERIRSDGLSGRAAGREKLLSAPGSLLSELSPPLTSSSRPGIESRAWIRQIESHRPHEPTVSAPREVKWPAVSVTTAEAGQPIPPSPTPPLNGQSNPAAFGTMNAATVRPAYMPRSPFQPPRHEPGSRSRDERVERLMIQTEAVTRAIPR